MLPYGYNPHRVEEGGMNPINQARQILILLGQVAEFPGAISHYSTDLQKYRLVNSLTYKSIG